jgi:hypothetical protein
MELDKLLVKIEADLSDLKRGLDKANNEVKKSSSKMSNEFKKFGTTLSNIGGKVITFGGLFATAFGAYQIKQVVDVGRQIEDLQVRLKALFGSAEEGARAFDVMVKFASKVPFSLQEIQSASGNLAVVADDAQELAELLEITGNVAGATGLSFQQTAEQIQRSFSGGIASADVFRERGVRSMLGFQVGAEVSINETVEAFKRVFGKGGEFGNVTKDLANTLTGTLSMLQDKLFSFRKAIADEFMVEVKKQFGELNNSLAKSQSVIDDFGKKIGEVLAKAVKFFADNIQEIIDGLTSLALFLGTTAGIAILKFIKEMNKLGLALGTIVAFGDEVKEVLKGLSIELSKSAGRGGLNDDLRILESLSESATKNVDDLDDEFKKLGKSLEHTNEGVETYAEQWARISDPTRVAVFKETPILGENLAKVFDKLSGESAKFNKIFDDAIVSIGDAFGEAMASGKDFGDAMKKIFESVLAQVVSLIVQITILKPLLDSLKAGLGDGGAIGGFFGGIGKSISGLLNFENGGYTPPNKPYLVGERGAEVFVPRTAGNIVPNNELGGSGVVVNQSISFSTGVVPTVRAEVLNLLPTIKQETINAVAEQRSRGGAFARTFGA